MLDVILLLLFNSLYIFGLWYAADYSVETNVDGVETYKEGEILGYLGYYAEMLPTWLYKPLLGCVVCMASLHSWVYPVFYPELTLMNLVTYIIYIFALSGFIAIVNERISH